MADGNHCAVCAAPTDRACSNCQKPLCGQKCFDSHGIFVSNIEQDTLRNTKQLDLVFEGEHRLQVGLSSVETEIPWETHRFVTQFFRVEEGTGTLQVDNRSYELFEGVAAIVPQGHPHRIVNTGRKPLKLYSVYAKDSTMPKWIH